MSVAPLLLRLLEAGVNLRIIQLWLGHCSPTTTAIDTHLTQKAEELASGVLDMRSAGTAWSRQPSGSLRHAVKQRNAI